MNASELWKAVDLDAADAALPDLPRSAVHVVVILASPGAREDGWAGRAALEMCRSWGADGAQVLLADAALEAPELHLPAGLDNLEGITDALLFGTSFQRLGQPLSEGLILATAGTAVPKGEALRAHPRWREFAAGFTEAGAILAIYLPTDAPGADALMELGDVAVALVRADEADAMEVPGSLLLLAATGPEGPSSVAPGVGMEPEAGIEALEEPESLEGDADDEPVTEGDSDGEPVTEPAAFSQVDSGLELPADDFVPAADDVLGDPFEEVSELEEVTEDDAAPHPEAPTLDEILAESGAEMEPGPLEVAGDFTAEDAADDQEPLADPPGDPLGAGPVEDPLAPVEATPVEDPAEDDADDFAADPLAGQALPVAEVPGVAAFAEADGEAGGEPEDGEPAGVEPASPDQPRVTEHRSAGKPAKSGPSPVLLFVLVLVVIGALVAGWLGFVQIPGITPAGGGVEEAGAAEVTPRTATVGGESGTLAGNAAADDAAAANAANAAAADAVDAAAAANPLAAWVLAVGSFSELETARSRARTYGTALPGVQFIVAPVEVDGVPYFRLLAGPAADVATLEDIQAEVARVLPGESEWILREAGYAFLISTAGRLALAERQAEVLERTGIPAHVLRYDEADGTPGWRVYSGAYANAAEAAFLGDLLARNGIGDVPLIERRGVQPE